MNFPHWPYLDFTDPELFFSLLAPDLVRWIKQKYMPPFCFVPMYPMEIMQYWKKDVYKAWDGLMFHCPLNSIIHVYSHMTKVGEIRYNECEFLEFITWVGITRTQTFDHRMQICSEQYSSLLGISKFNVYNGVADGDEFRNYRLHRRWKQGYYLYCY